MDESYKIHNNDFIVTSLKRQNYDPCILRSCDAIWETWSTASAINSRDYADDSSIMTHRLCVMKAIRNDESSMYVTLTMTWDEEIRATAIAEQNDCAI